MPCNDHIIAMQFCSKPVYDNIELAYRQDFKKENHTTKNRLEKKSVCGKD